MRRLSYNPQKLDEKSKAVSSQVFALNNNLLAYQLTNQFSEYILFQLTNNLALETYLKCGPQKSNSTTSTAPKEKNRKQNLSLEN